MNATPTLANTRQHRNNSTHNQRLPSIRHTQTGQQMIKQLIDEALAQDTPPQTPADKQQDYSEEWIKSFK